MTKSRHNYHKHPHGETQSEPDDTHAHPSDTSGVNSVRNPDMHEETPVDNSVPLQPEQPAGSVDQSLESLQMQVIRLMADYENYRKRVIREKSDIFEQANSDLIARLLPVLDNMLLGADAGLKHCTDKAMLDGLQIIIQQFTNVLTDFGMTRIETEGKQFDPLTAEAVGTLHSETVAEGVVMVEVRRGYLLKNRLLRAAQVIVSSGQNPSSSTTAAPGKE